MNTAKTELTSIIFICKIILFFTRSALEFYKLNLTAIMAAIRWTNQTCVDLLLIKATIAFTFNNQFWLCRLYGIKRVNVGDCERIHIVLISCHLINFSKSIF